MKIVHVIGSLALGGAETQLAKLSTEQARRGHDVTIILFDKFNTSLEHYCAANGVELINSDLRKGKLVSGIHRLYCILRKNCDSNTVIQSWMYGADLFVSLCSIVMFLRSGRYFRIFWNVRCTKFTGFVDFSLKRYLIALPCIPLSYLIPEKIICCAHVAQVEHGSWGYDKSKMTVIHNGFDESQYSLKKCSYVDEFFVLGFVGRYDPVKNFPIFVALVDQLLCAGYKIKAYVAGRGYSNELLEKLVSRPSVIDAIELKGQVDSMTDFYHEVDLLIVTSFSEGFPNVICEAALSGVDCLSFDVGDVSAILPNDNIIKGRSTQVMLEKIESRLVNTGMNLGAAQVRASMLGRFSIQSTVEKYEMVYQRSV